MPPILSVRTILDRAAPFYRPLTIVRESFGPPHDGQKTGISAPSPSRDTQSEVPHCERRSQCETARLLNICAWMSRSHSLPRMVLTRSPLARVSLVDRYGFGVMNAFVGLANRLA